LETGAEFGAETVTGRVARGVTGAAAAAASAPLPEVLQPLLLLLQAVAAEGILVGGAARSFQREAGRP